MPGRLRKPSSGQGSFARRLIALSPDGSHLLAREPNRKGPQDARWPALERWVERRLGSVEHERRVALIAQTLFDLTLPLHGLDHRARRLLAGGALVHDVGRTISREDHPEDGARLLLADAHLPVTATERRVLAYLTCFHRDAVPNPGEDHLLHLGDDVEMLRCALGILRAADALDSRSVESPRVVFALTQRQLRVMIYLREPSAKALKIYSRRKKFKLLAQVLGVEIELRVHTGQALSLVG